MYRDDSTQLDEHDRAVGAIQIADGLILECLSTAKQLSSTEHRWRAARKIHDDYAEIWRQLDAARHQMVARGVNTTGYDELRAHVEPVTLHNSGLDTRPLEDAQRAVAELRLAMPGADWKAIEARTRGLVGTTFVRPHHWWTFAGVAVMFAMAVVTWSMSATPKVRVDQRLEARVAMQKDVVVVVEDRKERIEQLSLLIGGRCDRPLVQEYVKLLVMEGRWQDAYGYGEGYTERCGADPEVRKWSKTAKKRLDRLSKL